MISICHAKMHSLMICMQNFKRKTHRDFSTYTCVYQGQFMEPIPNARKKVQVGKDHENAQSEKDSHSKNQGGKKPN